MDAYIKASTYFAFFGIDLVLLIDTTPTYYIYPNRANGDILCSSKLYEAS